jgi:hypothetical protein
LASLASFPNWLGLPDRRRKDRLWHRRVVLDLSACGRGGGNGNVEPVYASRLGPCDSCRTQGSIAVEGVFHIVGNHRRRMGGPSCFASY